MRRGDKICLRMIKISFLLFQKLQRENKEFLVRNAKYIVDEVVELVNDAIDYLIIFAMQENAEEFYVRQAMAFYVYHTYAH